MPGAWGWLAASRIHPIFKGMRRFIAPLLLLTTAGCFHYRVQPPDVAPATDPRSETVWVFLWGAVQQEVRPDDCQGNGTAEVAVSTNFGFTLLTVATLGLAAPATVQWTCAKDSGLGGSGDDF
jgi:hypothetical protein